MPRESLADDRPLSRLRHNARSRRCCLFYRRSRIDELLAPRRLQIAVVAERERAGTFRTLCRAAMTLAVHETDDNCCLLSNFGEESVAGNEAAMARVGIATNRRPTGGRRTHSRRLWQCTASWKFSTRRHRKRSVNVSDGVDLARQRGMRRRYNTLAEFFSKSVSSKQLLQKGTN